MDKSAAVMQQWKKDRPETEPRGMASTARVSRLQNALSEALNRAHARDGLTTWAFDVLATLRRQGQPYQLTHSGISRFSMLTNSAVTHRIDKLVDQGLVERVTNPTNRREVFVQLTEAGLERVESALDHHAAICEDFIAPLTADELDVFDSLMIKLLNRHEA